MTYGIGDQQIESDSPALAELLKELHGKKERPLCLCRDPGIPMYIAHVGDQYIIKRMPDTGIQHSPECESFEPPEELSGLGQVLGSAIKDNVEDGTTSLKFDFSLSKGATRAAPAPTEKEKDSVKTDGNKLTLRGTLHYLWEEAGFNKWMPSMEGKRNWSVIRKYLLQTAASKQTKGGGLSEILYMPETFFTDKKDEINQRRAAQVLKFASDDKKRSLQILIGEVKKMEPARYGFRMVVKHLPDLYFMMNEDLYARMQKRFHQEIELVGAIEETKQIVIATFSVSGAGIPSLEEAALMNVNGNWISYESMFDYTIIDGLTKDKRRFIKGLRYNMATSKPMACAVLTDCGESIQAIYIEQPDASDDYKKELQALVDESEITALIWKPGEEDAAAFLARLPAPADRAAPPVSQVSAES